MTKTNTATGAGELGKPAMLAGAALTTVLLGALGFAAINIPAALSSTPASAPVAPPNAGAEQPAPAPEGTAAETPPSQDENDKGDSDGPDQAEATEEPTPSESDDHPDRDSDRNDHDWLRESEADSFDSDAVYSVESGDTLSSISDEVGISVDMLAKYNDIGNVHVIYERSSLVIPYSEVELDEGAFQR